MATSARSCPTTTTSPPTAPRTSPGSHGPALVSACLLARRTAPWRVAAAAWLIRRVACGRGARRTPRTRPAPCTAVRERTRWTSRPSCSAALAAARAAISVSRSLGSTMTDRAWRSRDGVEQLSGRGAQPRTAGHDDRARLLEHLGEARPRGAGDHRDAARRRLAVGDLVGEVGDPHAVGAPGVQARLDRGTHVVDVHVDVPEVGTAHHEQGVAEPVEERRADGRPLLGRCRAGGTSPRRRARPAGRRRDRWWGTPVRPVGSTRRGHPAGSTPRGGASTGPRRTAPSARRRGGPVLVHHARERLEQRGGTRPPGVHDPGAFERGELVGWSPPRLRSPRRARPPRRREGPRRPRRRRPRPRAPWRP